MRPGVASAMSGSEIFFERLWRHDSERYVGGRGGKWVLMMRQKIRDLSALALRINGKDFYMGCDNECTVSSATIGLSRATKKCLESVKPPWMKWDEFLESLLEAVDPEQYYTNLQTKIEDSEDGAVERAKERYMKYRRSPQSLLTGEELKRRIRVRRLMKDLMRVHDSLKLVSSNPGEENEQAVVALLEDLDTRLHDTRDRIIRT